jgi:hypothetical protein
MRQFGCNFYVMQMLCSNNPTYEENLIEKLFTAAYFFNICVVRHLIPDDVWDKLLDYLKQVDPENTILTG